MIPTWFADLLPSWWPSVPAGRGTTAGTVVTGTAGDDYVSLPVNTSGYTAHGLGGNDLLEDSPGLSDRDGVLAGGPGDDVYKVHASAAVFSGSGADTVSVEGPGEGMDTAWSVFEADVLFPNDAQRTFTLAANVENLLLGENALDFSRPADRNLDYDRVGIGNGLDNAILGNELGNNRIEGEGGDDRLEGLGGNDVLDGGDGFDTAYFQGSRADYDITETTGGISVNDRISGRDNTDLLIDVEAIRFSDRQIPLALPDEPARYTSAAAITTPADGMPMFEETASDDRLAVPRPIAHSTLAFSDGGGAAVGTSGRDVFYVAEQTNELRHVEGREGDDLYIVSFLAGPLAAGDPRIIEVDGGGNDTVWVSMSDYVLPNGVESLASMTENSLRMLANDADNKLIGGPGDDRLFSGDGDDIVYGREGNDLIVGGRGADALFGLSGADTFAWEREHVGAGIDRIMDWEPGVDRIDLRGVTQAPPGGRITVADGADGAEIHLLSGGSDQPVVTLVGIHDVNEVTPFIVA
jgi:Ca2+-binding RTX toxin-like protein